jgi:hypothetical protein
MGKYQLVFPFSQFKFVIAEIVSFAHYRTVGNVNIGILNGLKGAVGNKTRYGIILCLPSSTEEKTNEYE